VKEFIAYVVIYPGKRKIRARKKRIIIKDDIDIIYSYKNKNMQDTEVDF